ncbi:hypothetical protein B296_00039108 [Ensete ventricosum]|uniref:Uncharacterized protein n=1 Tax=Ensete ventricosum TaxID=4639 RepID=A0A426YKP0_ENSVE|nr:hypothetical protein B296_00039108 [Ensete ventricosum]
MKRRRKVQLEGNSGDNKGREEGTKIRAVVLVAACTTRRRRQSCDCGRGLEMATPGRGRRGVGASDDNGGCGRLVHYWERQATVGVEK